MNTTVSNISAIRIWLGNLRLDKLCGNLASDVLAQLQGKLKELFKEPKNRTAPRVTLARFLGSDNTFCLRGSYRPAGITELSRIIDADSFARFHVRDRLLELGYETDESDGERVCKGLKNGEITPRHYKEELRTKRPFFWCTPRDEVVSLGTNADIVRDRLGLKHIPEDVYLLRIDIPATKLHGRHYAMPTALDGGCCEVYCSSDVSDGFGRTLDLMEYKDGVRELVVEPMPLDQQFKVELIGRTARTPADPDLHRLYQRCRKRRCRKRTKSYEP